MAKPAPNPSLPGRDPAPPTGGPGWRRVLEWSALAALGLAAIGWKVLHARTRPEPSPATSKPEPPAPDEPEEIHYADGRIVHPRVQRETRDVRFGLILGILLGMTCVGIVHLILVWRFFWWEAGTQAMRKESPYPLAPQLSTKLPPSPRLEQIQFLSGDTSGYVQKQIAAQEKVLHSYGTTGEQGFVHIPIEQAIRLTAEQLPARQHPPSAAHDGGLLDSGEPNSGSRFSGGRR